MTFFHPVLTPRIVALAACFFSSFTVLGAPEKSPLDLYKKASGSWVFLKGRYVQTSTNQTMGTQRVQEGRFSFHRPDKFRWEVLVPSTQDFIFNGASLWVVEKDVSGKNLKIFHDKRASLSQSKIVSLVQGASNKMESDFTVVKNESATRTFVLRPKTTADGIKEFSLTLVSGSSGLIEKMTFIDELENHIEIRFLDLEAFSRSQLSALSTNEKKKISSLFSFVPPRQTEVIETEYAPIIK